MKIAIIGGGASGLFCAANLVKLNNSSNLFIDIIEKDSKVGKKLLMTGNGRGNITNINVNETKYNSSFVKDTVGYLSCADLKDFFEKQGVLLTVDSEGRVYPYSDTSNTILDALRDIYINNFNVKEILNTEISRLEFNNDKIKVIGKDFKKEYDKVVICIGSEAGMKNISASTIKNLLASSSHTTSSYYPALAPFNIKENLSSLRGLRAKVKATLKINEEFISSGEVLFKDDALSGIVMFELSSFYARNKILNNVNKADVILDFLSNKNEEELLVLLKNIQKSLPYKEASLLLNGIFPKMLAKYILDSTKIDYKNLKFKDLSEEDLKMILNKIKKQKFEIDTNKTPVSMQIMVGGINLDEINPKTLESKKHKNLYFSGEVLNVDGMCGGYNLHFAFASGKLIASSIMKGVLK